MSGYLLLRHAHVVLALISISLFVLRGVPGVLLQRPLRQRWLRIAPHINDTGLLLSGLLLMIWSAQYPPAHAWLTLKLVLLVVYILLGVAAFRMTAAPILQKILFVAALAVFGWIVAIAMTRQALGVEWLL